ncbi:MAG TPA: 30S ribosomal protein S21 [Candidatus Gracilibacteria bacterium]|nr:30S ribosomal protein S21 [Candidatus Gracilibacteria bacterium]
MALTIVKNPKESVDRLISRFNKKVQASRVLLEVRTRRYFKKKPKKLKVRMAAIMRERYRSQREKMQYY